MISFYCGRRNQTKTSLENVNKQGYDYEKIYEGRFANGAYYYAYKLDKVDNLEQHIRYLQQKNKA